MQRFKLSKIVGVSILTLSTAIMPLTLPASAQIGAPGIEVEREELYEDNDFDWGWLGLIGLLGLAGLAGKKNKRNQEPTAYREPDVASRTNYRE